MPTVTFKVSSEEARLMRSQARQARLTLSEWLRRRTCAKSETPTIPKVRCEHTGAEIFGSTQLPPLTTESVREMLSDFP